MNQQQIIDKFQKLRFRISAMTEKKQSIEYLNEIKWVKRKIEDYEAGVVPSKTDLLQANGMWKRHSSEDYEYDEWFIIDSYIKDGRLINAIKEYRKIHDCSLKDANQAIEDRKRKIKGVV